MTLAGALLAAAIRLYQRRVSPRKGFSCAYRMHLGACSCSALGLRAVSRSGAWRGLGLLRLRLAACGRVAEHARRGAPRPSRRQGEAGFVDCDVPCDGPSCDMCDLVGCLDVGDADGCGRSAGRQSAESAARARRRRRRGDPVAGAPAAPPLPGG